MHVCVWVSTETELWTAVITKSKVQSHRSMKIKLVLQLKLQRTSNYPFPQPCRATPRKQKTSPRLIKSHQPKYFTCISLLFTLKVNIAPRISDRVGKVTIYLLRSENSSVPSKPGVANGIPPPPTPPPPLYATEDKMRGQFDQGFV